MFHCRAAEIRDANFDVCRFSAARKTIKLFLKDSFPNMGERKNITGITKLPWKCNS